MKKKGFLLQKNIFWKYCQIEESWTSGISKIETLDYVPRTKNLFDHFFKPVSDICWTLLYDHVITPV